MAPSPLVRAAGERMPGGAYDNRFTERRPGEALDGARSAVLPRRGLRPRVERTAVERAPARLSIPPLERRARHSVRDGDISKEDIMPAGRGSSSLKDPELYEELRKDGASKEKAARISNAAARDGRSAVGHRGGAAGDYDDWTVERLRDARQGAGTHRVSRKRKSELIAHAARALNWPDSSACDRGRMPASGASARAPASATSTADGSPASDEDRGAHPRARHPARLDRRVDLGRALRAHPGRRHGRRRPTAVPLSPALARAPRQGQVRAGAAAGRGAAAAPGAG